jgi:hypothetical protein
MQPSCFQALRRPLHVQELSKCAEAILVTKLKKPISFETNFGTYVVDELGEGASKRLGAS